MMLTSQSRRLWLAQHRVDFRKQQHGLLSEAYKLNLDPFAGDVIIFVGRNKRRLKVLYSDSSGLWVSSKVFTQEAMKTQFRFLSPGVKHITEAELAMVIEGSRYKLEKKVKSYNKPIANKNNLQQSEPTRGNSEATPNI